MRDEKPYLIRAKYCPTRKKNVPVLVYSDGEHSTRCWDADRCEECPMDMSNAYKSEMSIK